MWEDKVVTAALAMDWSSKNITEWRDARDSQAAKASSNLSVSVSLPTK